MTLLRCSTKNAGSWEIGLPDHLEIFQGHFLTIETYFTPSMNTFLDIVV